MKVALALLLSPLFLAGFVLYMLLVVGPLLFAWMALMIARQEEAADKLDHLIESAMDLVIP